MSQRWAPSAIPSSDTSSVTVKSRRAGQWAPDGARRACVAGWASPLTWPGLSAFSLFPNAFMNTGLILHFFPHEPR